VYSLHAYSLCKTLFDLIRDVNHRFIVVTHNCDINIDFSPPDNVFKWFSQNVNIIHEKIESIPIRIGKLSVVSGHPQSREDD